MTVTGSICLDLAAPEYIEDRDPGDEHAYPAPFDMKACPHCGCPVEPEPTDEERARLLAEPDFHWYPPDGDYLRHGYGLAGGGWGAYVGCDRCGFFYKEQWHGDE